MGRFFLAAWLIVASAPVRAALAGAGYYPSAPGTTWRYSSGETQVLEGVRLVRGVRVTPLLHLVNRRPVSQDLLAYRQGGVYLYGVQIGGRTSWYSPPLLVYPAAPLSPGQVWSSVSGGLRLSGRVMGAVPLRTVAGSYNALLLRSELSSGAAGSSVQYLYLVPGLGVVRYQTADGSTVDLLR